MSEAVYVSIIRLSNTPCTNSGVTPRCRCLVPVQLSSRENVSRDYEMCSERAGGRAAEFSMPCVLRLKREKQWGWELVMKMTCCVCISFSNPHEESFPMDFEDLSAREMYFGRVP
jgi:hypothetical protein